MRKIMHGRILDVDTETRGSELDADAAAGATALVVKDAADFDEDGGWLRVAGQLVEYTAVDDDASTITLKTGLKAAATEDQAVEVWNDLYDEPDTVQYAEVRVDGEDDQSDSIRAAIADGIPELPEGLRGRSGESCTIKRISPDDWEVVAVGGRPSKARGVKFYEDEDSITVTTAGAQTMLLTHEPLAHSEHLYWNGLYQPSSEWSRDEQTVSIPDAGGHLRVGDRLVMEYAYRHGVKVEVDEAVPWEAAGWSYTLTDSAGYSAADFDDSGWSIGHAPFGDKVGQEYRGIWPAPQSNFPLNTSMWVRRHVQGRGPANVYVRCDNYATVYWNGTQIYDITSVSESGPIPVPDNLLQDNNVLSVRGVDDGPQPEDWTYLDVRVERS